MKRVFTLLTVTFLLACQQEQHRAETSESVIKDTVITAAPEVTKPDTIANTPINYNYSSAKEINTGNTTPQQLLDFANTLIGVPYKYGSIDPSVGFDCSGFITYVFNHFKIAVPRSSIDFTNVPRAIPLQQVKPGDLILFTGTDSTTPEVGHMGIITSGEAKNIKFIHSTSGKVHSVTITPLNDYYMSRFVKVIRVFKQNDT